MKIQFGEGQLDLADSKVLFCRKIGSLKTVNETKYLILYYIETFYIINRVQIHYLLPLSHRIARFDCIE